MDHKAAGYHLARSQGAVCGKVGAWRAGREAEQLPDSPPRLDFYLRDNFGMAKVEWLVLYCTVLYCTVLYCIVLYCTVLNCTLGGVAGGHQARPHPGAHTDTGQVHNESRGILLETLQRSSLHYQCIALYYTRMSRHSEV